MLTRRDSGSVGLELMLHGDNIVAFVRALDPGVSRFKPRVELPISHTNNSTTLVGCFEGLNKYIEACNRACCELAVPSGTITANPLKFRQSLRLDWIQT